MFLVHAWRQLSISNAFHRPHASLEDGAKIIEKVALELQHKKANLLAWYWVEHKMNGRLSMGWSVSLRLKDNLSLQVRKMSVGETTQTTVLQFFHKFPIHQDFSWPVLAEGLLSVQMCARRGWRGWGGWGAGHTLHTLAFTSSSSTLKRLW